MNGEENLRPVQVDPQCIREALRVYLQPIKNEDPHLDFFTMYRRETMEYDNEYMKKYNEDLNTTLIFAGLFSAVSSAFVIDVQSKLGPDSGERSEAYLRAILLSLNRSIAPDESPTAPPAWNGPPTEIIATSDLLYASLLMSLLAAFVAMLGKQWLNRFLRHEGGSMVERCGDRQRKFDGLEEWPFRLFIESLPIMLQIALLLLSCGLSRYVWSVNTSVAGVVISLTVLGILFYLGIVFAGASSYECPFQTPASTTLRDLKDSGAVQKLLENVSPLNLLFLVYSTWKSTKQGFISASNRVYGVIRYPFSRRFSLSRTLSGIRHSARKVGRRIVVLLLHIDRAFRRAKRGLVREFGGFGPAELSLATFEDVDSQSSFVPQNNLGLRVRVRNLEALRKQNEDNAHCVCWVLRNITDPEAIDSAVRLAGTIRWFDGNANHDPPFDVIVSTFEACFDSTKQLYSGMRDRAYFSARAILRINVSSRVQTCDYASDYSIPEVPPSSSQLDADLQHILLMLQHNFDTERPIFPFPMESTRNHLLWASNLLVDMSRAGQNPNLSSHQPYLNIALKNQTAIIANVLLMWYMFLGGRVDEETFWAADKSDSLETIISHLSVQVLKIIDEPIAKQLMRMLEFLATWEKRPMYLTPLVYRWCSAISQVIGILEPDDVDSIKEELRKCRTQYVVPHNPNTRYGTFAEAVFSSIGADCDRLRPGDTSRPADELPQELELADYAHILPISLEIGFRLADPSRDWGSLGLDHTPHHERIFGIIFSGEDDETTADAVGVWLADSEHLLPGLCSRYLAKRMERDVPLSPRLRRVAIHALQRNWNNELTASASDVVRLLNNLNVNVGDIKDRKEWARLLIGVIRSPPGLKGLSPHHWDLLYKLILVTDIVGGFADRDVEVMKVLEGAEDWEKLEVWIFTLWWPPYNWFKEAMGDIEQVTLKLLFRQPSLLPRFEGRAAGKLTKTHKEKLREICDRVRAESTLSLESSPPPPICGQQSVPLPFSGDDGFRVVTACAKGELTRQHLLVSTTKDSGGGAGTHERYALSSSSASRGRLWDFNKAVKTLSGHAPSPLYPLQL